MILMMMTTAYNFILLKMEIMFCLHRECSGYSCDQTGAKASDDCGGKMTPGHSLSAQSPRLRFERHPSVHKLFLNIWGEQTIL